MEMKGLPYFSESNHNCIPSACKSVMGSVRPHLSHLHRLMPEKLYSDMNTTCKQCDIISGCRYFLQQIITVGTQRAYFELKYFKIVKMRDAK